MLLESMYTKISDATAGVAAAVCAGRHIRHAAPTTRGRHSIGDCCVRRLPDNNVLFCPPHSTWRSRGGTICRTRRCVREPCGAGSTHQGAGRRHRPTSPGSPVPAMGRTPVGTEQGRHTALQGHPHAPAAQIALSGAPARELDARSQRSAPAAQAAQPLQQ